MNSGPISVGEAFRAGRGADRMAAGLSCLPDPVSGDLNTIIALRERLVLVTAAKNKALEALKNWQNSYAAWVSADDPGKIEFPDSQALIAELEEVK